MMGLRLKRIREALDLTQKAFGEAAGVGATTVAGWESGRNMIDLVHLAWAAEVLPFSLDYVALGSISSLPHDTAVRVQALERAAIGAPAPARGRPRKAASAPLVKDLPDDHIPPGRRTLHDLERSFIPPPRARRV